MTTDNNNEGEESDGARRWYEALKRLDALQDVYEIVQAVATGDTICGKADDGTWFRCAFCEGGADLTSFDPHKFHHEETCPVTKARAILGK